MALRYNVRDTQLTVEFTVVGVACIGLNGGPQFKHSEAFSFQIATDDQAETDRYWNAIVGSGVLAGQRPVRMLNSFEQQLMLR